MKYNHLILLTMLLLLSCKEGSQSNDHMTIWRFSHIEEKLENGEYVYQRSKRSVTSEEIEILKKVFSESSVFYFTDWEGKLWVSTVSIHSLGEMHWYDGQIDKYKVTNGKGIEKATLH